MDKQNVKIGNWFIDQLNLYQSANADYEIIKKNFVIRENEFEIIIDALQNKSAKDPLQNELILGRRGSGKSTLLKRIEIEICENSKLNKKYIAINLAEEQAGIYRLFDLWEQVIEELKTDFETSIQLRDFSEFTHQQEYTKYLYQIIHEICKNHKKKIVLLLDNFDRIVENFNDDGNLLRETLINYNDIVIIAGSTRMDEHFWRYDMPFYEFFRRHRLEALSKDEMYKLLNHWSDTLEISTLKTFIENNPGKIENIRLLTDGLPRTIQFFIQMVLQDANSLGYDYLKKIMDNVTPLYQERLNYLPAQLRKIVLEMAFIWEACNTKQLVEKCKMESKLISANLKTLTDKGIVEKIETSKKNNLYRISERFFNMWLIITQGNPEQKRKAKWLSIFLENWYNTTDLQNLAKEHITHLQDKNLNKKQALILSKALSQCKYISTLERDTIIDLTQNLDNETLENSLIELPNTFREIVKKIKNYIDAKNYKKAIELTNEIENEEDGVKFSIMAYIFEKLEDYKKAENYYLSAIKKGDIVSYNNLALIYNKQKRYTEAEKYYLLAINNGNIDAIYNLANLYLNIERYTEAEKYFLLAIEKGYIKSFNNLALLYYGLNKNKEKALEYLQKYIKHKDFLIIVEIWNGVFNDVESRAVSIIKESIENIKKMEMFLLNLLIHQQKTLVSKLFNNDEFGNTLKEKYNVLYYACLFLNNKTEDNLDLRIPPEINDTINEVLNTIEEMQKFYGYIK